MLTAVCFAVQHIAAQLTQLGRGIKTRVGGVPNPYGIDRAQNARKIPVEQVTLFAEPPADYSRKLKKFPQRAVKVRGFGLAEDTLVFIKNVQFNHTFLFDCW